MIEVGEYVRTNDGIIGKIKRIELDNIDKSLKWYVFDRKRPDMNKVEEVYINKPYIVKHSKNIIDLIEEGDFVNGYPVRKIPNFNNELCNFDLNTMEWTPLRNIDVYYNILTKEQYQANCYTVERK